MPKKSKENKDDPIHKTLFTVSDKGQQKYGGWIKEQGKTRFITLKAAIKEARKVTTQEDVLDPITGDVTGTKAVNRSLFIEEEDLEQIRDIEGKNEEDAKPTKKRKRDVDEDEIDVPLDLEED